MSKGLYTQGMCVLMRESVSLELIQEQLKQFEYVGSHESMEDDDSPCTLVYRFREDVRGHLLVTPVGVPWPDDMGDPDENPERFLSWSLGQYGPLAYSGCLDRAMDQSWGWEDPSEEVPRHQAQVRFLISYVLGLEESSEDDEEVPLIPDGYDAIAELHFLTKAVSAVLELPEAICYFNPGGEVLRDEDSLRQGLNQAWAKELPPLDAWTNIRLFRVADDDWSVMDTVGNEQFDRNDFEVVYPVDRFPVEEIERFLRACSLHQLKNDVPISEGDTAEGIGGVDWVASERSESLSDPPRRTIRWYPKIGKLPPKSVMSVGDKEVDDEFDDWDELEPDLPDSIDDDEME